VNAIDEFAFKEAEVCKFLQGIPSSSKRQSEDLVDLSPSVPTQSIRVGPGLERLAVGMQVPQDIESLAEFIAGFVEVSGPLVSLARSR